MPSAGQRLFDLSPISLKNMFGSPRRVTKYVSVVGLSSASVETVGGFGPENAWRRPRRGERLVREPPVTGVTHPEAVCVTVSR